jgi:membrane associated rhomboid family serine protease
VLIPIGLDQARLSRLPWASIVILALNVLAFVGQSVSGREAEVRARYVDLVRYWSDHPDLEPPPRLASTPFTREDLLGALAPRAAGQPGDPARLDALAGDFVDAFEAQPERTFGLVPARGLLQPGWIGHLFLHADLWHLLGNMLVFFLVVAPFLEDAWGRPFFVGLYLAGGVVAGMAQALPSPDSQVVIIGASGAISACLGAFALRFAHRRVRMFYWLFLFLRGTFSVPAWLYAVLGFAADLWGLSLLEGSGVAYGAHVGGFLFGVAAAVAVRATGLEARLAPEGSARWGASLQASRASDALAGGDVSEARRQLEEAIVARPDDQASLLALARLEAARFQRSAVTPLVERLVDRRLAARDVAGARAVLAELGQWVEPHLLRPAAAFRAAEVAAAVDPALADRLDEAAAAAGGALGAKALLRLARRAGGDPGRARAWLERLLLLEGLPPELGAQGRALLADLPPAPDGADRAIPLEEEPAPAPAPPAALHPGEPVRVLDCRVVGSSPLGLHLVDGSGRAGQLGLDRIAALSAALVEAAPPAAAGRATLLLDLLLAASPGQRGRTVLRIAGHALGLGALHPGVEPREAWARLVGALLERGARPVPSPEAVAGRPFPRFPDAAAFEEATWGRRLTA